MDGSTRRLLIVEDDGWTRFALTRLMKRHGWSVQAASTLAEGLNMLGSRPECVILDLNLPDGSGEGLLRHIRERGIPGRVVVSTGADEHEVDGLGPLQPDAVIYKPIELKAMLAACDVIS